LLISSLFPYTTLFRSRVFPRREERILSIGFSLLLRAVANIAHKNPAELAPILQHHGDLGAGAEEILRQHPVNPSLGLPEIAAVRSEEHTSELQSLAYL